MLWVDKHRPSSLEQLTVHPELTKRLQQLVIGRSFPHLLVSGPRGAGKKTRIMAFLRAWFGPKRVDRMKVEQKSFRKNKSSSDSVEITTLSSAVHVEITPADAGVYDRVIIQQMIKEMAQTAPVDSMFTTSGGAGGSSSSNSEGGAFKVIILNEVDRLSIPAQQALRRTMEKYMSVCRLILLAESTCHVIEPLRSRCLPLIVPAAESSEVERVLAEVVRKESLQALPPSLQQRLVAASSRNLRRALIMAETCYVQAYPWSASQSVVLPEWETFVDRIGAEIISSQSAAQLYRVRGLLYEVLVNAVPPPMIMRALTKAVLRRVPVDGAEGMVADVIQWAAHFEHQLQCGQKPIMHMEAFVARVMAAYKRFQITSA